MLALYLTWAAVPGLAARLWRRHRHVARWLFLLGLAGVCTLQDPATNKDRGAYSIFIQAVAEEGLPLLEPAFLVLIKVLQVRLADATLELAFFFVVALASLAIKFKLLERYGGSLFGSLATFFSYFFLTQEMTQVRVGLGIGLLYLSWFAYAESRWRAFWVWGVLAAMCHYSCVLFMVAPLLFSVRERLKWRIALAILTFVCVAMAFAGNLMPELLSGLAGATELEKLQTYSDWLDEGVLTEITPARLVPHVILLLIVALHWKKWRRDRISYLLAQIYMFGLVVFALLSPIPVLAYRVSDLFLFASVFVLGRLRPFMALSIYIPFVVLYTGGLLVYTLQVQKLFGGG